MSRTENSDRPGTSHRRVRRGTAALAVLLAGPGLAAASLLPAAAAADCSAAGSCVPGDVQADGTGDTIVGRPDIGGVDVFLTDGGAQQLRGPTAAARSGGFGASVSSVDLDHDGFSDLAVGAPGVDRVYLYRGSASGVATTPYATVTGPTADARFGVALATVDRAGAAGRTDLWVGAPLTEVDGEDAAGAVHHYVVGSDGTPRLKQTVSYADIPGAVRTEDQFGSVLAGNEGGVVVGVPDRAVSGREDAGQIAVLRQQDGALTSEVFSQASAGIAGSAETRDRFGASVATYPGSPILVGIPGEDVGSTRDAGAVEVIGVTTSVVGRVFTQDSAGVPGSVEAGDAFGSAVTQLAREGCDLPQLAVGVPGEDLSGGRDAGMALTLPFESTACADSYALGSELPGQRETNARVGESLATVLDPPDQDTLLIGAPGEESGQGMLHSVGQEVNTPFGSLASGSRAFGLVLASPGYTSR